MVKKKQFLVYIDYTDYYIDYIVYKPKEKIIYIPGNNLEITTLYR